MENPLVLGADIGGSHITAGLIDLDRREIISTSIKHQPIDPHENADVILNSWCRVIEEVYAGHQVPVKKIGLAMPGPFDYEKGICLIKEQDKFKSLYLLNVRDELAGRMNLDPGDIKFVNDAEAFLRGEIFTAPAGYESILGITLGTGLGSALYGGGKVWDADLWNSPFKTGIAEEYLSASWLIDRYFKLSGHRLSGVKELSAFVDKDPAANQVFSEFGTNLGQFLRAQADLYELELILLGGNISYAFDHFSEKLGNSLALSKKPTQIRVSQLKENAALIGAAAEEFNSELDGCEHNYKNHEK